jgi:threonine dehydrogenase-like Zn-dependent dehydrogenase
MRALVYTDWGKLELQDVVQPIVNDNEVLVRVAAVGICGSELHQFATRDPRRTPPLILGHEFSGTISELGAGVDRFSVGQRVVANPLMGCGHCLHCSSQRPNLCEHARLLSLHKAGAFAEFVAVSQDSLHPIPDSLELHMAALAEPLATAVHGLRVIGDRSVANVAIIGAGGIGLMVLQMVKLLGAIRTMVIEPLRVRRVVARALGADLVLNPFERDPAHEGRRLVQSEGFDLVVDAVGLEETRQASVAVCRPGGTALWLGLDARETTIPGREIVVREKRVQGSFCYTDQDFRTALSALVEGNIRTDWVHEYPFARGVETFLRLVDDPGDIVKALLLL